MEDVVYFHTNMKYLYISKYLYCPFSYFNIFVKAVQTSVSSQVYITFLFPTDITTVMLQ